MEDLLDFLTNKPVEEHADDYKEEKLTIFNIIDAMTINKIELDFTDERTTKAYDQYMINRFLSMDESLFYVAEMMNTITNLTDEQHFDLLKSVLPKEKFYIKYMKGKKDVTEKEKRYIADYYEIGLKEASSYIQQMTQEEIDNILKKYKYGKNEMIIV